MNTVHRTAALVVVALLAAACGEVEATSAEGGGAAVGGGGVAIERTEEIDDLEATDGPEDAGDDIDRELVSEIFVEAVASGDPELAAEVAEPDALDFFEPWEGIPDATLQQVDGERSFFVLLGPGHIIDCTFTAEGWVARCADEPEEPEEPEEPDDHDDGAAADGAVQEDQIAPVHGGEGEDEHTDDGGDWAHDDPSNYTHLEWIFPEEGAEPVVREGGIVRGTMDAYVVEYLGCCTGDTLYVDISSLEGNAVVHVYAPDGTEVATETTDAAVLLDEEGEWWIAVGATRGNAEYSLQAGIAVDAS